MTQIQFEPEFREVLLDRVLPISPDYAVRHFIAVLGKFGGVLDDYSAERVTWINGSAHLMVFGEDEADAGRAHLFGAIFCTPTGDSSLIQILRYSENENIPGGTHDMLKRVARSIISITLGHAAADEFMKT